MTNDDGSFTAGTVVDKAFVDQVYDQIDAMSHSTGNPGTPPKTITDEVIAARATAADLNTRIAATESGILAAGTQGQVVASLGKTNLAIDETFLIWPAGDTTTPYAYTFAGAGGSIQRCGTALADTNRKIGDFCVRIRRVAADTTLMQDVLSGTTELARAAAVFQSKVVGYGAWVRSTAIAGARLSISDGVGTTYSTANVLANTWEWLTVTRTLDAAATLLRFGIINDVNGADAYWSVPTITLGATGGAPVEWFPSPVIYDSRDFFISGNVAVVSPKFVWTPHRPGIVKDVQLTIVTAPTGADLIADVKTWDGAAFTSMYSAGQRPRIIATGFGGGGSPDATYARACLKPAFNVLGTFAGTRLSIDIAQVGAGVVGADLCISVRMLYPARFFEVIADYNHVGV